MKVILDKKELLEVLQVSDAIEYMATGRQELVDLSVMKDDVGGLEVVLIFEEREREDEVLEWYKDSPDMDEVNGEEWDEIESDEPDEDV